MSTIGLLEQALKLLRHKGTEKELAEIAKNLSASDFEKLRSAYKNRLKSGFYHGTSANDPFEKFDLNLGKSGANDGPIGAAFVTENPKFAEQFKGPRGGKVLKLRVNTENIFDYNNPEHIKALAEEVQKNPKLKQIGHEILEANEEPLPTSNGKQLEPFMWLVRSGDWEALEHPETIKAIKNLGFDGMHVSESGEKNIALFDPNVDARYENAEFNPLKKDTGGLTSSIAGTIGAAGAGTAAAMMPEDAEAAPISKIEDIAKVVSKLKNPTTFELMKELNYPKYIRSQKQATEAHIAATNLLNFAIRDATGNTLSNKNAKVIQDWINLVRPYLKGKIHGLEGPEQGVKAYMDRRIAELLNGDFKMTHKQAYEIADTEIRNAGGMYWPKSYRQLKDGTYIGGPGEIYLFDDLPGIVEHEAGHFEDYTGNPMKSRKLNESYSLYPNFKYHLDKNHREAVARARQFMELSPAEFEAELLKAGAIELNPSDNRLYVNKKKINEYVTDRFRLLPDKPSYPFGKHFLGYNHFEPERAAEILSDAIKVPVGNPLENEMALHGIVTGQFSDEEIPAILQKMEERSKTEVIPKNFMEYKKRQFEHPVYDKPKSSSKNSKSDIFLSDDEEDRLQYLNKKFGGINE